MGNEEPRKTRIEMGFMKIFDEGTLNWEGTPERKLTPQSSYGDLSFQSFVDKFMNTWMNPEKWSEWGDKVRLRQKQLQRNHRKKQNEEELEKLKEAWSFPKKKKKKTEVDKNISSHQM